MDKNNKRFVVDSMFIKNVLSYKLSMNEFLLLMYFDNSTNSVFDVSNITKYTCMKKNDVMEAFSSLVEKKIINVKLNKNAETKKMDEIICIESFYENNIKMNELKKMKEDNDDVISMIESEFSCVLDVKDKSLVNNWFDNSYSIESIVEALRASIKEGVTNIRFMDKILTDNIVSKSVKSSNNDLSVKDDILSYNWLDND